MSHYVCEIVIPPKADIEASVAQVMAPFDENSNEDSRHAFWDFYVIGGRFSGNKMLSRFDPEKLDDFYKLLEKQKITVAGVVCGKQRLQPENQIPKVDALWREHFPGTGDKCLLFDHANDQYGRDGIFSHDVCTVAELTDRLTCCRLIIAGKHWNTKEYPKQLEAKRMLTTECYNGVEFVKTTFDGKVKAALASMMSPAPESYEERQMKGIGLTSDWLVVTVDYHS